MTGIPHNELAVYHLTRRENLTSFDSGNKELNDFLKDDSLNSQNNLISQTYLCFWKGKLTGFITLVADTIQVKVVEKDDGLDDYDYSKYPAIKIARLAVDKSVQKKGVGKFLLFWALGKVYEISKEIGCRYITVDSKHESIEFYKKHDFKLVTKYETRDFPPMYLNMYPIISGMRPHESFDQAYP